MATIGDGREKRPPDIFYKCHPQEKLETVICVVCDNGYHRSEFDKKEKNGFGRYLTKSLI